MSENLSRAMREAAAKVADEQADAIKLPRDENGKADRHDEFTKQLVAMKVVARDIAAAIRSLPLPPDTRDGEIARAEARGRAEGLRKASGDCCCADCSRRFTAEAAALDAAEKGEAV